MSHIKTTPSVEGIVTIQLIDSEGNIETEVQGSNIWTITGREFLSELMSLSTFSTIESNRGLVRNDRVAYIGVGIGAQLEVAEVSSLVNPISYDTGDSSGVYLAVLDTPCTYPSSTAVQFTRTFGATELSASGPVVITEVGLFTDGDPLNNFVVGTLDTSFSNAFSFAPVAYKTFEPITKTSQYTMKVVWEVRFV